MSSFADFDRDNTVLLAGGRDEARTLCACQPVAFDDLREGGTFGAGDHLQDLRALALRARGGGLIGGR